VFLHRIFLHDTLAVNIKQAQDTSPDKPLFYAFCILLVWLPLPLGSNRPWAWSIMDMTTPDRLK